MKEPCPNNCNKGHLFVKGSWVRCSCLEQEIYKRDLGVFATERPNLDSPLIGQIETSMLLDGPMPQMRKHISGVIIHMKKEGKTFTSTDAYRLVDIFLEKDTEFSGSAAISDYDLYVMLLGFGEVKNQRLPDLILQVLMRRELLQKPTWVILGIPLGQVPMRFSSEVHDHLQQFQKARIA